ncbi:unnamed protein product [Spirodela intermedia]|uniref:Uncharacterized protein n=1 Tax=Spirodela intermedia TaxID=51605 RepID=A0A7I8KWW2_SPIIN|nr:unnamed protein product [Spirodela intermedia]
MEGRRSGGTEGEGGGWRRSSRPGAAESSDQPKPGRRDQTIR